MKIISKIPEEWPSHFNNRQYTAYSGRRKLHLRNLRLAHRDFRYVQPKSQDLDVLFQMDMELQNWN